MTSTTSAVGADNAPAESIHKMVFSPRLDLAAVEEAIKRDPAALNAVNPENAMTPIQAAARRGHSGLLRLLGTSGADLEVRSRTGETPFLLSCQVGSLYAVHALVECGANVRAEDNSGKSAMHFAAQVGAVHIMHYLSVTQGLGFQCTDNDGNTPLHLAVVNRNLETLRYLLRHNRADVRAGNKYGSTALHVAAKLGSTNMAWILVNSTKDDLIALKDANGYIPEDHAKMGQSSRHQALARKLRVWSMGTRKLMSRLMWLLFFLLPCASLLFIILSNLYLYQPVGFVLSILILVVGFFMPLRWHRIPNDSAPQNPALLGALLAGITHTLVCYFQEVFPRIWPGNALWFTFLLFIAVLLLFVLVKALRDPGIDRVGKLGSDGNPLTIVDVAREGNQTIISSNISFCTSCEIVIPERTKHCKLCEGCCRGFDHHCLWLMNCVGYRNHRFFVIFVFLLMTANILFLREAFWCLSVICDSFSLVCIIEEAFFKENWILVLIIGNFGTALFAFGLLFQQLGNVSRMETTYFDAAGRAAYGKKRERKPLRLSAKLRLIHLFFTNYPKWFASKDPDQLQRATFTV